VNWIRIGLILIVGLLPVSSVAAQAQKDTELSFETVECWFETGPNVECGYVTVPEDHNDPDGATIRLAVAIIHSQSRNPKSDPVVYLQGGPGGVAIEFMFKSPALNLFGPFFSDRDFIVFDQRGVGLSEPSLHCPEYLSLFIDGVDTPYFRSDGFAGRLRAAMKTCRERLLADGIDLSAYTTDQNAADVALLQAALGYEQINLLGISYGTRLALNVMRDHPDGIRSVILDSPLPFDINLRAEEAANMADSFARVFASCRDQFLCRIAYPDVEAIFYRLFTELNQKPVALTVEHPVTGAAASVQLDGYNLTELMQNTPIPLRPALIYALRDGEYEWIDKVLQPPAGGVVDIFSAGMQYAVFCSDFMPFAGSESMLTEADVPEAFSRSGLFASAELEAICADWVAPEVDPLGDQPVASDIPTLVLAGEYDPLTPPAWGQRAATTLENSYIYTIPGASHGVLNGLCPLSIARNFLNDPASDPGSTCMDDLRPPEFVLSASVSRPWANGGVLILGTVALWFTGYTGVIVARRRGHVAWKASLEMIGWKIVAASAAVVGLGILLDQTIIAFEEFPYLNTDNIVMTVVSLFFGAHAAFLFSPDDEPALEILLALPRRIGWILVERFASLWLLLGAVGLVGAVVVVGLTDDYDLVVALSRWAVPALVLSSLAVYITISSREAILSIMLTSVLWGVMLFLGDTMVGRWPLLWPIQLFLSPEHSDFALNRLFLTALSLNLLVYAVYQLHDEERVLGLSKRGILRRIIERVKRS
jgi:pimeloyl-ACP methyl ester carboxylesterase